MKLTIHSTHCSSESIHELILILSCTVDVNHLVEVQRGFLQLLELGKHSDVTFIITAEDGEDYHIPAHRVILASQSEYFDKLLFGEMKEAHPDAEIPLQDTPLEAFQLAADEVCL